ncbi:MAG: DUF2851 family protein [Bacteroidales bacterium]|nr:DUF2851 family protein [Bacteroidales bacterium]
MKEEFLHFIWKNRLFGPGKAETVSGKRLEIIEAGTYNRDSGPDFFNARIRIGNTEWAGNIEIHDSASDWCRHKHHLDHGYDNIILHVVVDYDCSIKTASGNEPESFVMTWDRQVEEKYNDYLNKPELIACSRDLNALPRFTIRHWISRMAIERLDKRIIEFEGRLRETNNDWDETAYRLLSRYFGLKVNSDPFYLLASCTPLRIIRKHADNRMQVEALLYGQAGMLETGVFENEIYDEYYSALRNEYRILRQKYSLRPIDPWMWKYHRLRPANFPTIRISQLAGLLCSGKSLFGMLKESKNPVELAGIFRSEASAYWDRHYVFGTYKKGRPKRTGDTLINLLLINTIIPLLFLYGKETGNNEYCTRATDLLDSIEPEDNRITREWSRAGVAASSALESQGLLHLREIYCKNRLCLDCQYGSKLISLGRNINPGENYLLEEPGKNTE